MSSSLSSSAFANSQPQSDQDYGVYPIALATKSVNMALTRVAALLEQKNLPVLKSADIIFKTITTTGWSLGLSIFVLTFLFSRKHQQISEVTIHYEKDEPALAFLAAQPSNKWIALEDELVKQIESVAESASSTQIGGLPLQQIIVSVEFGIDWTMEGGIKTPTLVAITADSSKEKEHAHTIKLTFQNPS